MTQGGSELPGTTHRRRRTAAAVGIGGALLLLGIYTVSTGIGALKGMAVVLLLGLFAVNAGDRRFYWTPRLLIVVAMSYGMLVTMDAALAWIRPRVVPTLSIRHMYTPDPELGYRLSPGWRGRWDDGVVQDATYTINAQGYRDTLPQGDGRNRILLLGDSFTFGMLLDDSETIDREIEARSQGRVDAYNLGIPGYGAHAVARVLARNVLPARRAVYLFYENDLRNDGQASERNTIHQGFMIPRLDEDGRPYSQDELDARVAGALNPPMPALEVLKLRNLVQAISKFRDAFRQRGFHELRPGNSALDYDPSNLGRVVESTEQMRGLAEARGMEFAVLIIPSLQEVGARRYYSLVELYRAALSARGVRVIEMLGVARSEDYWVHDGHFSPAGARTAALAILDWVE